MKNLPMIKKLLATGAALFMLFAPGKLALNFQAPLAPQLAFAQQIDTTSVDTGLTIPTQSTQNVATPATGNTGTAASQTTGSTNNTVGAGAGTLPSQTPSFYNCVGSGGNLATCSLYLVSYVANAGMGVLVNIGAFLVRLGLQFNDNVYNSPAVLTGFSITLALANLGFVLGIIIIAIATILRNQTYGIKQLLWKLVFMAILVNFGLVITAPIVGFASSLSNYFVTATANGQSQQGTGYEGFAQAMTAAFQPQALQVGSASPTASNTSGSGNGTTSGSSSGTATVVCGALGILGPGMSTICSAVTAFTSAFSPTNGDQFVQQIFAMVFDIVFSALIAFTFLCLAILLIIRYLMLGGLLIVLPLAWLTFIFPKFDNSFSKWWNTFIKWTFFPPLALFFIYLAFLTATNTTNTNSSSSGGSYMLTAAGIPNGDQNGPEMALARQTGLAAPIQQAADEILLVGLTVMGLMFAQSLSGKAGSTVVNGVANVSRAAVGYVGKKGRQAGSRLVGDRIRTAGRQYNPETKETTTALQRFGARLQGVPIVGKRAGVALANLSAPKAVQADRKEAIDKYIKDNLENMPAEGLLKRAKSATAFADPTVAAAVAQRLAEKNLLNEKSLGSSALVEKYVDYAERMGTGEAVFKNRPDLMKPRQKIDAATGTTIMETKEEAVARAVRETKGDVTNINAQVFNMMDPAAAQKGLGRHVTPSTLQAAVVALSPSQLGTLGNDPGSTERKRYITDAIKNLVKPYIRETTKREEILDPSGKGTGSYHDVGTGKFEFDPSKPLPKDLENLKNLAKHMENSPNWASPFN